MAKYKVIQGSLKLSEGKYVPEGGEVELAEKDASKLVANGIIEAIQAAEVIRETKQTRYGKDDDKGN